jgi:hypothetical protein
MAVEITVILRFEQAQSEDDLRVELEDTLDCQVIEYEEEEV